MQTWQVGDVTISCVVELESPVAYDILVLDTHFPAPTAGYIRNYYTAHRFEV